MAADSPTATQPSLTTILSQLLPRTDPATHNPDSPNLRHMILGPHPSAKSAALDPKLTAQVAALQLHPTLEAALHILNADLAPAHFLVRHMQAPPAVEGMLLHCVLHRCEGDFDNADAWAADVCRDGEGARLVEAVYGWSDGVRVPSGLTDHVRKIRRDGAVGEAEVRHAEREAVMEMTRLVNWCGAKFGTGRWEDASGAWVRPGEKIKQIGQDMTTGDKGWRDF